METALERIRDWFENDKKRGPHTLKLKPNSFRDCNLSCIYYKRGFEGTTEENNISFEENMKLIDEASSLGTETIDISGSGEPLMCNGFLEIISKIKKEGMEGVLTTNGTLFDENIVKEMVEVGWDEIALSLDGPDAKTQDKLRPSIDGKKNFSRVIRTLDLFKKWKERANSEKPRIIFVPVLNKFNFEKMPEFVLLAKKFNVRRVSFKPLMTFSNERIENLKIPSSVREKLNNKIRKTIIISDKYNVETNAEEFFSEECVEKSGDLADNFKNNISSENEYLNTTCFEPWLIVQIFVEEKLASPCIASKEYNKKLCENSLEEIWFSDEFNELRDKMKNGEVPDFCRGCCGGNLINTKRLKKELTKN